MILVTVGTHDKGFERLVRAMDLLAAELDELVVIQYGSSRYIPRHAQCFQWCTSQEMEEWIHQARVIVCHAAAGTILTGLLASKPLVVVPRRTEFGEVVDNHQLQLSSALDNSGRAVQVIDPSPNTLSAAMLKVVSLPSAKQITSDLTIALRIQLTAWSKGCINIPWSAS